MDDLKSVTMSYLRDLARKHLGSGYSKLNKKELIAALAQAVPALKKLAKLAGVELPAGSKSAARPAAKVAAPATKQPREPARGKETRAVDKKDKKKEPQKKAPEPKKEQGKKAPVARKEPEKKAPAGKKAPEPKKEPEKKAPAARKEPEKKAPEPKKEPEKKAAAPQGRKGAAPRPAASKEEEASASRRPAQVVNFPPRVRSPRSAEEAWQEDTAEMVVESPELEEVFQHAAEPLVEGFFVARMMGERELRRHHLTEEQARSPFESGAVGLDENLGELPLDYGNDLALALARDPHTLFITWDFSAATRARAMEGLNEPRAMLRVFDGERLVREVEVALESRSFYIHGLPPGRPYRVEAHFVDRAGRSRRIGSSTHPLTLPQTGPSSDKTVRFMQLPPPPIVPVQGVTPAPMVASALSREELGEERQYITWHRVPLPGSADLSAIPVWRERLGRRGEGARPSPPPPPEHLEVSARPLGSSEQMAGRGGPDRGGASEQTHWTPPPSGRGR